RIARAAMRIDGDAPASIESRRRCRTPFRARVEGAALIWPLRLGSSGLGRFADIIRRAELPAALDNGGGRLRQCLGYRERAEDDKHARCGPHIRTPSSIRESMIGMSGLPALY